MVESITATELAALLTHQQIDLIDVRDRNEWDAGHIPGARSVPLEQLRADPDAVLSHDHITIFICAKGVRSLAAAKLADRFGFTKVYSVDGGTKEWASQGLPLDVSTRVAA